MPGGQSGSAEYYLQKYLLLLATVVATVAYAAAFNPPGGAWQVTDKGYLAGGDHHKGRLAGEPIIRSTHYLRYLAFFYCNAVAFASSIVVIILILALAIWHDLEPSGGSWNWKPVYGLRVAMAFDLLGLMGGYAAGTSQDEVTTKNDWLLVAGFFVFLVIHMVLWHCHWENRGNDVDKLQHHKVLMVLATFITSITYTSGLSMPGGFWDSSQGGHSAGDPILQGSHRYRLRAFFFCNTTSFAMSLLIIVLLMEKEMLQRWNLLYPYIAVALLGLVGAYAFGSCREMDNTVYVASLLAGAFLLCLFFWVITICRERCSQSASKESSAPPQQGHEDNRHARQGENSSGSATEDGRPAVPQECHRGDAGQRESSSGSATEDGWPVVPQEGQNREAGSIENTSRSAASEDGRSGTTHQDDQERGGAIRSEQIHQACLGNRAPETSQNNGGQSSINAGTTTTGDKDPVDRARSLVELLAVLAATVTYQAGLVPPGGVWQDNLAGHKAGDPILLSTDPKRYKVFFYCNSMAFVVSLVVVISARYKDLLKRHALEMTMMLDLFGLMGAYASGSCRDVSTSMIIVALVGAILICTVTHVVFFTLDVKEANANQQQGHLYSGKAVHKRRKMLLLLAVLGTTVTYQAGLTPPSGFQQSGQYLGDPVLLHNYPRRYKTFFYSNSVTFASSIALIILLVSPNMYMPAIQSYGLHVCTIAGMVGLVGAFTAGSTQHLDTSIYILVLAGVVLSVVLLLLVIYACLKGSSPGQAAAPPADIENGTPGSAASGRQVLQDSTSGQAGIENGMPGSAASAGARQVLQDSTSGQAGIENATPGSAASVRQVLQDSTSRHAGIENGTPGSAASATQVLQESTSGQPSAADAVQEKQDDDANPKSLMLLGVLAASITYQAGLNPPGGVWQDNSNGHAAGDPVMHDNRRHRYTAFFYSNSASFVASIALIILLLWEELNKNRGWLTVLKIFTMVMNMLGLLGAYAAGSTTEWETFGHVIALLVPALFCVAVQMLPLLWRKCNKPTTAQATGQQEVPAASADSSSTPTGGTST